MRNVIPTIPLPAVGPPDEGAGLGARTVVAFTDMLRRAGVEIATSSTVRFAEALGVTGFTRQRDVYWAGRATLVRRPEDLEAYDATFAAFWFEIGGQGPQDALGHVPGSEGPETVGTEPEVPDLGHEEGAGLHSSHHAAPSGAPSDQPSEDGTQTVTLRYSPAETLATKDFARLSDEELEEVHRLMARLGWVGPRRTTRRRRRTRHRGGILDIRSVMRDMSHTGGEPFVRRWLEPATRERRVVFVCDVSGSMAPYARMLLRFLHAAAAGRGEVEAFTVGTRLTRVTRALDTHDPDAALAAVARAVPDWSGGTRIGAALGELNGRWASRGLTRGAVVVILSDGWDCGDPALLAEQMARLSRLSRRIVWVNPLRATPGYEPLVRGMVAALPYVDHFVDGHSMESLEALADVLGRGDTRSRRVAAG